MDKRSKHAILMLLCFAGGEAVYRNGKPLDANPWPLQTDEHQAWQDGWIHAQIQALFSLA